MDFGRWKDESDDEYGDDFNFDNDVSFLFITVTITDIYQNIFSAIFYTFFELSLNKRKYGVR